MKKRLLLITTLLASAQLRAQYIDESHVGPIKLADVVEEYYRSEQHKNGEAEEAAKNGLKKEGKDYHFGRWYWYWKNHTDQNGYLVSPLKTFQEWQKYSGGVAKTTAADMSNWLFQGPTSSDGGYHGIGRINNIEFHPSNQNIYWVCTAGGGLWKTINDGVSWTNLTDHLPVLGTSDLEVNPLNPNTMYLCTGDRDASDSYSIGVLKSTDGGITWVATGLNWTTSQTRLTNALVLNKVDTNSLTLATSDGMYKSYNGGTTWTQIASTNNIHFKQVLQHPTDTAKLYATTYGNGVANIYRSANGGASWTALSLPGGVTNKRRIALAVTPQNVAIVKAIVAGNNGGLEGIYNSTDTGKTFTKIYGPTGCNGDLIAGTNSNTLNSCGSQGWYDLTIAIDPTNVNRVYVGGVNTRYSNNGGASWSIATQWYAQQAGIAEVHADKHWHAFHPLVPGRLFECNDGGVYKTDNPASTLWTDLTNGMGITQFYRNAVADTADYQLAGSQDNGTKMLSMGTWYDPSGGDGMNCEIDYADPDIYYTAYQYGDINRFSNNLGNDQISDNIPGQPSGAWITPYIISPHNHYDLLAGYRHIYYSTDAGSSWISITGKNLTTSNLERLAMAPSNDSTIYAVADNSSKKVFYTHAFFGSQVNFDSLTCPNAGSNITDIKVDPKDNKHFYLTLGGYNSDQVVEYSFNTNTWTKMNTALPNVPVHCIDIDSSNNIMYVGTDVGVFYLDTINKQWAPFNKNLPSIEVADLGINYKKKEIWAATYGRGLWKSIKQSYVTTTDTTDTTDTTNMVAIIPYAPDNVVIMPNPSEGVFSVKATSEKLYGRQAKMVMMDNLGKVVWTDEQVFNGSGLINVNVQNVATGIYQFVVSDNAGVISRKRIVVR